MASFIFKNTTQKLNNKKEEEIQLPDFIIYDEVYSFFNNILKDNQTVVESIRDLQKFIKIVVEKINEVKPDFTKTFDIKQQFKQLNKCQNFSRDQIVDCFIKKMANFWKLAKRNPELFETKLAEFFNEKGEYKSLNRVLSYGIYKDELHLHAPPSRTVRNKTHLYLEAINLLAKELKKLPSINYITATSYLVKRHQNFFKKLGFQIHNLENKSEKRAVISKNDFLKRFSKD